MKLEWQNEKKIGKQGHIHATDGRTDGRPDGQTGRKNTFAYNYVCVSYIRTSPKSQTIGTTDRLFEVRNDPKDA